MTKCCSEEVRLERSFVSIPPSSFLCSPNDCQARQDPLQFRSSCVRYRSVFKIYPLQSLEARQLFEPLVRHPGEDKVEYPQFLKSGQLSRRFQGCHIDQAMVDVAI